jgi:hypothetical protein
MQLEKKGIIIIVIVSVVGGFIAGFLGSRVPEMMQKEKIPKTVAALITEPEYVEMEKLESKIKEQVDIQLKPYEQKLESWESEKKGISSELDQHNKQLKVLERSDDYFHGVVVAGSKRIKIVEDNIQNNQEEILAVKEELGPGDKYAIQVVYANPQFKPKFNASAYDNKFYIDELLNIVEEWHKDDVIRVAIVERPQGKGKAVFFAGSDNRFNVEIVRSEEGIDKLLVLSANNSISSTYTMSRTEAPPKLRELFNEYGSASLLPFKSGLKKPSTALLFGEEPETGKYQGKYYVR